MRQAAAAAETNIARPPSAGHISKNIGDADRCAAERFHICHDEQPLGVGACGIVYRAIDLANNDARVAVKVVDDASDHGMPRIREVSVAFRLRHRNIVILLDSYLHADKLHLVSALAEHGDLLDWVNERMPDDVDDFDEVILEPAYQLDVLSASKQIAAGMTYAHEAGVAHRDLKLHNILVMSEDPICVKIADWGMAYRKDVDDDEERDRRAGTAEYVAPEVFMSAVYRDDEASFDPFASDTWSYGVMVYILAHAKVPFDARNLLQRPFPGYAKIIQSPDTRINTRMLKIITNTVLITPETRYTFRECSDVLSTRSLDSAHTSCSSMALVSPRDTANSTASSSDTYSHTRSSSF